MIDSSPPITSSPRINRLILPLAWLGASGIWWTTTVTAALRGVLLRWWWDKGTWKKMGENPHPQGIFHDPGT